MMNDNYSINNRFARVARLLLHDEPCGESFLTDAYQASVRLLNAALFLPKGGYLGWQIAAAEFQTLNCHAFTNCDETVARDDLCWTFETCAAAWDGMKELVRDVFAGNRRTYALVVAGQSPKNEKCAPLNEALDELLEADAVIRLVSGVKEDGKPYGIVVISLPGEMSLRLRTMLTIAMPGVVVSEIGSEQNGGDACGLTYGATLDASVLFLQAALVREEKLSKERDWERKDEFTDDYGDFIPLDDGDETPFDQDAAIEDLELSVRSYNCLKRAGIKSVKELKAMSPDEMLKVRNLGRKGVREICEKIGIELPENFAAQSTDKTGKSHMDELDELIGLDEVKSQVRKIAAYAKMKKDVRALGRELTAALNMEFVGNPGTAKTTVARIVAGIFGEIGLMPGGEVVEVGRADLVAKYVGQTAVKVKEAFERARGKVLFIDEAYSLLDGTEGEFGDEAINTMVQEMENHREDTVVILAGYPDQMKALFERNPGLRSRVPFQVHFPDYSAGDLLKIAELEAKRRGFSLGERAREKAFRLCETVAETPDGGNGRFCRNLVENAILAYAERNYGKNLMKTDVKLDFILTEADFEIPAGTEKDTVRKPIGFLAA